MRSSNNTRAAKSRKFFGFFIPLEDEAVFLLAGFVLFASFYTVLWELLAQPLINTSAPSHAETIHWLQDILIYAFSAGTALVLYRCFHSRAPINTSSESRMVSGDQVSAILHNTAEGIVAIDERGIIRLFNAAAESLFGFTAEEALGQNVSIIMPVEDRNDHEAYVKHSTLHEPKIIGMSRDLIGQKKDGTQFPISLNVTRINSEGLAFVAFIRDISERKKYETEILEAKVRAESANISKATFLASMSHEFRTPLNAMIGFSQMLEQGHVGALEPQQKEYVELIASSSQHLHDLISDVLALSEIESGTTQLHTEDADVREVIDQSLKYVSSNASAMEVSVSNTCSSSHRKMRVDPLRFRQIMINLLSNAIKYNRHGGWVKIDCEETQDQYVRITVTDRGMGIPKEKQVGLFEPFNRLGREAGNIEGTGIGLSITKDLVELMNGRIGFQSEEGQGSSFWIEFPAA